MLSCWRVDEQERRGQLLPHNILDLDLSPACPSGPLTTLNTSDPDGVSTLFLFLPLFFHSLLRLVKSGFTVEAINDIIAPLATKLIELGERMESKLNEHNERTDSKLNELGERTNGKFNEQNEKIDSKFYDVGEKLNEKVDVKFNERNERTDLKINDLDERIDGKFNEQNEKIDWKFNEQNEKIDSKFSELGERTDRKLNELGERTDRKFNELGERTDRKPNELDERTDSKLGMKIESKLDEQNEGMELKLNEPGVMVDATAPRHADGEKIELKNIIREDQLLAISSEVESAWTSENPSAYFVFESEEELTKHDRMFRLSVAYDLSHHDTHYKSECPTLKISGVKLRAACTRDMSRVNICMPSETVANIIDALNKTSPYPCEIRDCVKIGYSSDGFQVRCNLSTPHSIHMLITKDDIINAEICATQVHNLQRKREIQRIATSYSALARRYGGDYKCDLIVEAAHQWKKNLKGVREEVLQVFFNVKELRLM